MKKNEPIEGTAQLLLLDLELLDIHDVWENAGSTRYGYVDQKIAECRLEIAD